MRLRLTLMTAAVGAALAGCGGSTPPKIAPVDRIVHGQILMSPIGAQRIGIETAPVTASGSAAIIPLAAVVYDPSGAAFAFTSPAPLTFTEVPITVDRITGSSVYLRKGPAPGTRVVTVGAEELYGVQTGVLAQT
jgi:hypothetical protein